MQPCGKVFRIFEVVNASESGSGIDQCEEGLAVQKKEVVLDLSVELKHLFCQDLQAASQKLLDGQFRSFLYGLFQSLLGEIFLIAEIYQG